MSYIMNKDDVVQLAVALNASTQMRGKELFFKRCPYCNGGGHDDYTFSVNTETGAFKCFRSSCNKQGHFVEMARDFNYPLPMEDESKRIYKPMKQVIVKPSSNAVKYLEKRGIARAVSERYRITTHKNNPAIIVFPFYDENNILTCVKYRNTEFIKGQSGSKEWCSKDTKPILFGMQECKGNHKRLIITEGQIDSLSVAAAGIENSVSVPTGQSGFTWVKFCADWVDTFSEIVVFGDNEHGHITLVDGMLKHFSKKKIYVVRSEDYLGEKDANDILRKYGKEAVRKCIENAQEAMTDKVKRLSDVQSVDLESQEHIRSGIYALDRVIGGLYMGSVTVLTGRRGEGKSTLASQIVANALDQADNDGQLYSVFIYSGELPNYHFKRWLDLQIAGTPKIITSTNDYGDEVYSLADETVSIINAWYHDRAYIYDNSAVTETSSADDGLFATIETEIQRHNTKLILIDNLMTGVEVGLNVDLYRAQSQFVNSCKQLAMKYNVAVLLIAHPRKEADGVKLTNESISGSGDIANRVDTVLTYERVKEDASQGRISVTKNRLTGNIADNIEVTYGKRSKRISCNNEERERVYGCFVESEPMEEAPPF